jgi:hypothetical protein
MHAAFVWQKHRAQSNPDILSDSSRAAGFGRRLGAMRTCPGEFSFPGPSCFKAGEAHLFSERNPVHGGPGSLTSFNLAGVGSFEPGNRPNRT